MKKSAILAAVLVLCTSSAFAYENSYAGYSVKDGNPFYKVESSKLYAYSSIKSGEMAQISRQGGGSVHVINYFTAADMQHIVDVPFTTAYFNDEYAKLALQQRSQIDIRTVHSPLIDFDKYSKRPADGNLVMQAEIVKAEQLRSAAQLRVDKIGKFNAITQSYLIKQDKLLVAINTTLVSANDSVYMLTTINSKEDYFKAAADSEPALESVKAAELPASLRNELWQEHSRFVKSFKAMQPTAAKQQLQYTDTSANKTIKLPDNWFYGQLSFNEKAASGCLTMAASLDNLQKIAADMDYLGIMRLAQKQEQANPGAVIADAADGSQANTMPELTPEEKAIALAEARKLLHNFDAMLVTCSFKPKDKDFVEMLDASMSSRLAAELMLKEALNGLKRNNGDYFVLNNYNYKLDFTAAKQQADINANISILQEFVYDNLLSFALKQNNGSLLWYLHKNDFVTTDALQESIKEWQL